MPQKASHEGPSIALRFMVAEANRQIEQTGPIKSPRTTTQAAFHQTFRFRYASPEIPPHGKSVKIAVPKVIPQFRIARSLCPAVFRHAADRLSGHRIRIADFQPDARFRTLWSRRRDAAPFGPTFARVAFTGGSGG